MGRYPKSFTIDEDLLDKLKEEENASDLVNSLLNQHYSRDSETNIEEKLSELQNLESEVIKAQELKRDKIKLEIETLRKKERELADTQTQKLDADILLLESQPKLCEEFMKDIDRNPKLIENTTALLDWVTKFRDADLRIGTIQLKNYYKHKRA